MIRQVHIGKRQRGVSAIEFAIVLPIIMLVFYAMVGYAVTFLYTLSLNAMATEVARTGVQIYTTPIDEDEDETRSAWFDEQVKTMIDATWLTTNRVTGCAPGGRYSSYNNDLLDICLAADRPMAPLNIFGITVPDVPERLLGRAVMRLAP